jgi:hypothetical protein
MRSHSGGRIDKCDAALQEVIIRLNGADYHTTFLLAQRQIIGEDKSDDRGPEQVS